MHSFLFFRIKTPKSNISSARTKCNILGSETTFDFKCAVVVQKMKIALNQTNFNQTQVFLNP